MKHKQLLFLITFLLLISRFLFCQETGDFEHVVNWNFEDGNVGFTSELEYNIDLMEEGRYYITDDPSILNIWFPNCDDNTSGDGKMMVINSDTVNFPKIIWKQDVTGYIANEIMIFSFYFTSVNPFNVASLRVRINGVFYPEFGPLILTSEVCNWSRASLEWDPQGAEVAEIEIYNLTTDSTGGGNDFALDDITLKQKCKLDAFVGEDKLVCKGEPIEINSGINDAFFPAEIRWEPAEFLDNPNAANPVATVEDTTAFVVFIEDSIGCEFVDTVMVYTFDDPQIDITASKPNPICPVDFIELSFPEEYSCQWDTGETSNSITVNEERVYYLAYTDIAGCTYFTDYELIHDNPEYEFSISDKQAEPGEEVTFELKLENLIAIDDCDIDIITAFAEFNSSVLTPRWEFDKNDPEYIPGRVKFDADISDSLHLLTFGVSLGNEECSEVTVSETKYNNSVFTTRVDEGEFCLLDLCQADGIRLFDDNNASSSFSVFPNPSNDMININFSTMLAGRVKLSLFDIVGKEIVLINEEIISGHTYNISYDLSKINAGTYILHYETPYYNKSEIFVKTN